MKCPQNPAQLGPAMEHLRGYFTEVQADPADFLMFYGSCTYGSSTPTSDIDLFIGAREAHQYDVPEIVDAIKEAHAIEGRELDEEVPFANKVLYSHGELSAAANLEHFTVSEGGIVVPKIVKSAEFLASAHVKARLAFNALTTPHIVCGDDLGVYVRTRQDAERHVGVLACGLLGIDLDEQVDAQALFDALVCAEDGSTGEDFLGYKTHLPVVAEHLRMIVDTAAPGVQ